MQMHLNHEQKLKVSRSIQRFNSNKNTQINRNQLQTSRDSMSRDFYELYAVINANTSIGCTHT